MKRVLVVCFSQTGQLTNVVDSFIQPLLNNTEIDVVFERIEPRVEYPFPWPFMRFFSIFPEAVYMDAPEMKPYSTPEAGEFDLIILAYQVWFLSPSLPVTGFLRSDLAEKLFRDKPVITLIACRDMWLTAQEKIKKELNRLQARLIDNVVLVDEAGSAMSFFSTPLWMFTGRKGPWRGIPKAGVADSDVKGCGRFGKRIAQELTSAHPKLDAPLLKGLGAVKVKEKTIASELLAHRSFLVWGRLLRIVGGQDSLARRLGLCFYIGFLVTLILTLVPISAVIKKIISPLSRKRIARQKQYYAAPSGEECYLLEPSGHE